MKTSLIGIGKGVVIAVTLAAWCAALPAPTWADQPRRTPEQIAENIRKMEERFRLNDRADAERLQKSLADAAERARKKEDERLLAQVDAAEKLGPNLSPTGVMVKGARGNWVNADRSGRPLPPPAPPVKPFDPKAKEAAEKKVKDAFDRDHRKALEDQARRDKEAEDKAAERRARYGLAAGEDAGPTGIMIKVGGKWVPAGLDGKPVPPARPKVKVDPVRLGAVPQPGEAEKAQAAAEARVRAAFDRDHQKALDDAAKRDRAADEKAGERLLKYGTVSALPQPRVSPNPVSPKGVEALVAIQQPMPAAAAASRTTPVVAAAPRIVQPVQAMQARPATQAVQATQAMQATQATQLRPGAPVPPAKAAAASQAGRALLIAR